MNDKIKRILAAIIDFYIICFLSSAFICVFTLGEFSITPFSIIVYLTISLLLLLFKDFMFKNTSIGKRIFKLKVAKTDGTNLMIVDVIKRNIPIIILLPVEALLLIINNRRIGDIWVKTSIVYNNCNINKSTKSDNRPKPLKKSNFSNQPKRLQWHNQRLK